jgi:OFA family oxalate/formate antiporter-like MFS transporter
MVTLSTAFGLSKGFTMESAVVILMAFNLCNGLGRLVSGYASDSLGRNSTMSGTFFAAGLAYFVLPHVQSLLACGIFAAVIGFAFGTLFSVSAPLAMDCFGVKHFGAIFGLTFTAYGFVAGPIGPSLSGFLLDITRGNFAVVFGYLGVFCLISSVLIRFVTPPRVVSPARADRGSRGI